MVTVEPDRNPERPQVMPWVEYVAESTRQYKALLEADPDEPEPLVVVRLPVVS